LGRLLTIEIDPATAKKAEGYFERAGVSGIVTVKIGDAREVVRSIEGPVDFLFLDCNAPNYLPCLQGIERSLAPGATVVADNVGISEGELADYFEHVRREPYKTHTEWFNVTLPWTKRDAMEISTKPRTSAGRDPRRAPSPPVPNPPAAKDDAEKKILEVLDDMDRNQRPRMLNVPIEDGRLLRILAESIGAKHVVEIGMSNGYSGIWFCLALRKTGGHLTTHEIDEKRASLARENFRRAGVADLVTIVMGEAHETVKKIAEPIDLLFIDADKEGYPDYLAKLLPLVRPAVIIACPKSPLRAAGIAVTLKKR